MDSTPEAESPARLRTSHAARYSGAAEEGGHDECDPDQYGVDVVSVADTGCYTRHVSALRQAVRTGAPHLL
jgi:hypothetical protein